MSAFLGRDRYQRAAATPEAGAGCVSAITRDGETAGSEKCEGRMRRLFTGAMVWMGAGCVPCPGWLLVDGDRISEVGDAGDPVPEADEVVEAAGRHVLPGFVDVHSHLTVAAWMPHGGDGAAWRRLGDALGGVRRVASAVPGMRWLVFWNVSVHAWPEGRLPTADELDGAAPGRKVLVCAIDLHRGVISRAGFEDLGLAVRRRGQLAGDLGRDLRGRPTGELWEAAFGSALYHAVADMGAHQGDAGVEEALRAEAGRHLAYGITHAHDPYVSPSMHARAAVHHPFAVVVGDRVLIWAAEPPGWPGCCSDRAVR